jgi:hypothetical protein
LKRTNEKISGNKKAIELFYYGLIELLQPGSRVRNFCVKKNNHEKIRNNEKDPDHPVKPDNQDLFKMEKF